MKGNISIGNFIQQIKKEFIAAQNVDDNPFYELKDVELEISFALDTKKRSS